MPDYQKMYYVLFNAITDTLKTMQMYKELQETYTKIIANQIKALQQAQQTTEEMYIDDE